MSGDPTTKYLSAYPPDLRAQVRELIIVSDGALYDYVGSLKSRHMRSAGPLAKAVYDSRLHLIHQALGTHTAVIVSIG